MLLIAAAATATATAAVILPWKIQVDMQFPLPNELQALQQHHKRRVCHHWSHNDGEAAEPIRIEYMCDIAIRRNSTGGSTGDRTVIISSVSSTLQLEEWAILSATAASGLNKKCSCPYRTTTATPRPTVSPPMLMFRLLSAVRRIVGQMYKGLVFDPSLFAIVTYYSNPKLAGPGKAVVDCTQHNKQDYAAQGSVWCKKGHSIFAVYERTGNRARFRKLQFLIQLTEEHPNNIQWHLWMDADALIADHSVSLQEKLSKFQQLHGFNHNVTMILCRDHKGKSWNKGVFLIRNNAIGRFILCTSYMTPTLPGDGWADQQPWKKVSSSIMTRKWVFDGSIVRKRNDFFSAHHSFGHQQTNERASGTRKKKLSYRGTTLFYTSYILIVPGYIAGG